jgi:OOP family OmpA-OmpF porin
MKSRATFTFLSLMLIALVLGCVRSLPRQEPLAIDPMQFGERELRDVNNVVILVDASESMRVSKGFPSAQALSSSFVRALPARDAPSSGSEYNVGYIAFGGDERVKVPLQPFDRGKVYSASQEAYIMGSPLGTGGLSPLHDVFDELGGDLDVAVGKIAVILFSDGEADDPYAALAAARRLSRSDEICFYTVQVGSSSAGANFMNQLSRVTSCGNTRNASALASAGEFERYAKSVMVGMVPLPPVAAAPPSCTGKIRLRGIEFGFDRYDIAAGGAVVLDAAYEALSECTGATLQIDGYTDSSGPEEYNQRLSERRAVAVRDYFVDKGIAAENITLQGHGMSNPVASNDTREGRARNRRVELSAKD